MLHIAWDADLITKRGHARLMRALLRAAMQRHRSRNIPHHFELNPETREGGAYHYARRSRGWMVRKAKLISRGKIPGPLAPLVYTGQLREDVKSRSVITATQYRSTFKARAHFPLTQQRHLELETVSEPELNEIAKNLRAQYAAAAQKPEYGSRLRKPKL